jgi:hypothetical protein
MRNLKKKLVYDEKKFELGIAPNRQNTRYWREKGHADDVYYIADAHAASAHVFAAVSYYSKSQLRWYVEENPETPRKRGMHVFSKSRICC